MNDVFTKSYYCYGNLLHHENDTNVCTNIWAGFWYHDSNNNSKRVVIMACQNQVSESAEWCFEPP